jgi:tetratricopeptide (TPR) repeat protein
MLHSNSFLYSPCLNNNNDRLQEAIKYYDLALKYGHDEFVVKFRRGILYMKLGELEKASLDLEYAIKLKPSNEATKAALNEIQNLQNKTRLENEIKLLALINQAKETELKSSIKEIESLQGIKLSYQKTIEINQNRISQLK